MGAKYIVGRHVATCNRQVGSRQKNESRRADNANNSSRSNAGRLLCPWSAHVRLVKKIVPDERTATAGEDFIAIASNQSVIDLFSNDETVLAS